MLSIQRLQLHITERCNLACTYCYARPEATRSDMSLETAQRAIIFYLDHLSDGLDMVTISFFGGEPLLKWNLIRELVPYASKEGLRRNKNVRFSITCNGTAIRAEVAEYLAEHQFATLISWDGNHETQDRFRVLANGRGSSRLLERALPHIRSLPNVGIRMTWTRETLPRLADNVRYFAGLGLNWVGFAPLDNMTFTEPILQEYRRQIDQIADFWCEALEHGQVVYINPLLKMMARVMSPLAPLHFHMHRCDPLRERISVACDGTLFPCHRFLARSDWQAGNVMDGSLNGATVETFSRLNQAGLDGCLALTTVKAGNNRPCYPGDLIQMMEISLEGSTRMLRRGAEILNSWPPERIPPEAAAVLSRYSTWCAEQKVTEQSHD